MKSAISNLSRYTETNAIDSAISTVDDEVSDLSALVTTETNAIDSAISTVDDEVSDLSNIVTTETNAIDSAISTVDDEVSDLGALVTTETNESMAPSPPLTMKSAISVLSLRRDQRNR